MELRSIIEALLFTHGEPISIGKLSKIIDCTKDEVLLALNALELDYQNRGLVLLKIGESYQLGSSPTFSSYIGKMVKGEFSEELSRAAMETLAIVAYRGPLTRIDIEYIRGVNSSFILRSLILRGLIDRIDNPKDTRSYLYQTSFDLLRHFGVTKIEDLPGYQDFKEKKVEIPEEKLGDIPTS